jgi:hypothetical protein
MRHPIERLYGKPIAASSIEAFEAEFGVVLPPRLREIALHNDGGMVDPDGVAFPHPGYEDGFDVLGLGEFYSFEDGSEAPPAFRVNRRYREAYPGFIVFSQAGNGWDFALAYGQGREDPEIVLFTSDARLTTSGCIKVADSFDDLLENLIRPDERPAWLPPAA